MTAALAVAASLCVQPAARGGPVEDCLDAPSVGCIVENFGKGADLPLRAIPSVERPWPSNALRRALLALGEADEVERVSRRNQRGAEPPKGDVNVAVVRFLASARAGAPDFGLLDGEDVARSAHWLAGQKLLRELAADAGVAEPQDAPPEKRAALRESAAWRGLTESYARWNESVDEKRRRSAWTELARLHLGAGDTAAARAALERVGTLPADLGEVGIWFRLGDRARAEARARASGDATTMESYSYLVTQEALSRRDTVGALAALEEEWALKSAPRAGRAPDFRSLRGLVLRTAEAGDRALAVSRAGIMRGLPADARRQPEAHWIDAAGALNDIGEHDAAARLLRELLARRPDDLAAAEMGAALPVPAIVRRGDYFPYIDLAAELLRAGMRDQAERLLRAAMARDAKPSRRPVRQEDVEDMIARAGLRPPPGMAERTFRELRLMERAMFFPDGQVLGMLEWHEVMARDAASPERIAGLLDLASGVPAELRALVLLDAAQADARHGRAEAAGARVAAATGIAASLPFLPYRALCGAMGQAAKLGREDLADAAFRAGVAAARAELEELRPTALLHVAACRGPRPY